MNPNFHQTTSQTPSETISYLSPVNPLNYLRLLAWLFFSPHNLTAYPKEHGKKILRPVGYWLGNTLAWLSLVVLVLGLALGRVPTTTTAWSPTAYGWLCGVLLLAWGITGWLGETRPVSGVVIVIVFFVMIGLGGGVAIEKGTGLAVIVAIGVAFSVATEMPNQPAIVMAVGVAVVLAVGIILAVAVVTGGVVSLALAMTVAVWVVVVVAVGLAGGRTGGVMVVTAVMLDEAGPNGRPSTTTIVAGIALIICYAFLIWFTFFGGAAALG